MKKYTKILFSNLSLIATSIAITSLATTCFNVNKPTTKKPEQIDWDFFNSNVVVQYKNQTNTSFKEVPNSLTGELFEFITNNNNITVLFVSAFKQNKAINVTYKLKSNNQVSWLFNQTIDSRYFKQLKTNNKSKTSDIPIPNDSSIIEEDKKRKLLKEIEKIERPSIVEKSKFYPYLWVDNIWRIKGYKNYIHISWRARDEAVIENKIVLYKNAQDEYKNKRAKLFIRLDDGKTYTFLIPIIWDGQSEVALEKRFQNKDLAIIGIQTIDGEKIEIKQENNQVYLPF
ncbi:hypothetical protein OF377_02990 [Ureaplasma sp. ES3154-GEN]|uniref:hypothetical protein n=1 Tax=Ureaplasma sp. ES3154-GEN TaxID=2984844 RepID=UPI0021E98E4F|nr:hypothetical protein [Ureaplasma sp. ES3154-GEN]MCV3743826.1 hypothetical protein [Ureaplasma sp. ES3154-GEN]